MNNQNLKAILQFFYFDAELNGIPEPTLHQWKSKDNINWDFVGADARDMATVNANYVEKKSINKFDRTTLATASAPIFTSCPANMTVNANLPGCKASISFAATATGVPAPSITYRIGNTVITSPYVFSKGNTTVTAIATNGVAPDASCNFIVTVVCGPRTNTITSAENRINTESVVIKNKLALSATPNPSDHYFTLSVKSSTPLPFQVRIFDMLGRVVEVRSKVTPNSILFIGHNYRPGVYFVEAIQGKQIVTLKLVKQAY
jgi:hypothetical protein